jgi:hypothetical protein
MHKIIKLWSISAGFLLLTLGVARADINLCNHTNSPIWVTYGEEEWYDGAMCHVGDSTTDEIHGWWHPGPGQCVTVEAGCNCNWWANFWGNCPGDMHFYGENDAHTITWGRSMGQGWNTCTPWAAFDQCDNQWSSCPNGRWLEWGEFHPNYPACNIELDFQ